MATQSEAALEQGLIKALQDMSYEYVKISEETNLHANFKAQLEKHNRKELAKRVARVSTKRRNCVTCSRSTPRTANASGSSSSIASSGARTSSR